MLLHLFVNGLVLTITLIQCGESTVLQCYQCSSLTDPGCKDPFSTAAMSDFLQDCPVAVVSADNVSFPTNYTRCRKIVQTVTSELRVTRMCATAGSGTSAKKTCLDRVGTTDVRIKYCECANANGCNVGHTAVRPSTAFVPLTAIAVFLFGGLRL
jgi:hypothetical protein